MIRPISLVVALGVAATSAASTAAAQSDLSPIDAVIVQALTEQRLVNTCGALLDPNSVELMGGIWDDMAAESLALLDASDYESLAVTQLRDNATAQAVRLHDDTPFGEVIAFCAATPDWWQRLRRLEFIDLTDAILAAAAQMPQP